MAGANELHRPGFDIDYPDKRSDEKTFRIGAIQFAFNVLQGCAKILMAPREGAGQGFEIAMNKLAGMPLPETSPMARQRCC